MSGLTERLDGIIMNSIKAKKFISIPEIQHVNGVSYRDARDAVEYAAIRGWLDRESLGNRFRVLDDTMSPRSLDCDQLSALVSGMDTYEDKLLEHLMSVRESTLLKMFKSVDEDDDDISDALQTLVRLGAVARHKDVYFVNIDHASYSELKTRRDAEPKRPKFDFDF